MAYAIMRAKKLNGMGSVASALQHCYRDRETPNADAGKTPENEHHAAHSTDEAMGRLRDLLPEKRRKDAVLAVEYVLTASPEWWESASPDQRREFFEQSKGWLADKYGADRIVTATVHQDEKSPHLSAFVVPLTQDGRLSAKEFIGNRTKMTNDQTSYAARVAHLGLERGIEGSRAKHQSIKGYYAAIERPPAHVTIEPSAVEPRVLRKGMFSKDVEGPELVAQRLTQDVRAGYADTVSAAAGARQEREKAKQYQDTAKDLRNRLQPVLDALGPLNRDMQAKAAQVIKAVGEKLLEEQRETQRQKQAERQQQRRNRGRGRDRGGYSR